MPAQTSLTDVDRGDYIEHVYTFDNSTTRSVYETKPGVRVRDQDALAEKLLAALNLLEQADTNWATLTANQKDNAARLTVRVSAAMCRYILNNT
jgi:hypothetical protein